MQDVRAIRHRSISIRASVTLFLPSAILGLLLTIPSRAVGDQAVKNHDIAVTLQADGEHCVVRKVRFLCADLPSHLRDNLKLPKDTMVRLRAGRTASFESIRRVLTIIEKSGYRYPGARPRQPGPLQEQPAP
jgi:biopolymer transport protein ExbD